MKLTDKVIVVTGAGSGIGRELALQLIAKGAIVAGADYNEQALLETQQLLVQQSSDNNARFSCHVVDISNNEQVIATAKDVVDQHGQVDGVINNAGIIQPFSHVENLAVEHMQRIFNVNWWGVVYMTQAFLPALKQSTQARIVNISSMGGYMPFPGQVIYGASKAAVKLMTEGLMVELADTNVGVSVVYPGAVQTNITNNAPDMSAKAKQAATEQEDKKVGVTAQAAAQAIIKGIEKDKSRILVGSDCKVIDKLYRLMPVKTAHLMSWLMKKFAGIDMTEAVEK
ncbi:SDR family NAD(P)-dependent oxidoreductase [Candidatus Colwellia aromaticivorans]|uniref:SDR family NAD(P)-dependent oxidoreductase n=1 Tax=Candidatus Colwellia aromaticivorans TaxID=2267621 RepID=UPI000DF39DF6|nr:SDR family oxidoreductase [Candidatus Colwellia aromaticivorans]